MDPVDITASGGGKGRGLSVIMSDSKVAIEVESVAPES